MASFGRLDFSKDGSVDEVHEKKLDLRELDKILKKNTAELPDHLQGASFLVFNKNGPVMCFLHTFQLLHLFGDADDA